MGETNGVGRVIKLIGVKNGPYGRVGENGLRLELKRSPIIDY